MPTIICFHSFSQLLNLTIINSCKYIQNPFFIFAFHKDIAKFKEILLLLMISGGLSFFGIEKIPGIASARNTGEIFLLGRC